MTENKAATTNIASLGLNLGISQINTASLGIGSVLTANSPVFAFGESIRQFKETIDKLLTPQRMMREVLESWAKQHQEMFRDLANISDSIIPKLPVDTVTTIVKEKTEVLEGEIVDASRIEVIYRPEILMSAFGIGLTVDGRFYDKVQDVDLAPLNIGSTAGKYFMLLLTEEHHFLLDTKLYEEIPSIKYHGGKEQLRQDLRKILLRHGLELATKRTTKLGTVLVGIKRL